MEWLLGTILKSNCPIPIYLSWGKLPRQISPVDVPTEFAQFVPDADELKRLVSSHGDLKFSRWAINHDLLVWYRDPYTPALAPVAATALPPKDHSSVAAAPFPPLPPNSEQKINETIEEFFIRRRARNLKKMVTESSADRQRRTQRAENAKRGVVPSKSFVFLWEKQDGHYIRQPTTRGNFADVWADYPGPQRRFDPIHNQWDLCELFEKNDPVFGEGYDHPPDDDSDDEMGNCVNLVYLRFGVTLRTEEPEYESVGDSLLDTVQRRFGFVIPSTPEEFVARDPPAKYLDSKDLANVVGMTDIGNELASQKGLDNTLRIFFGQCTEARSVNNIDKKLLDYHQHFAPISPFRFGREYLRSMRNPSQQHLYYVLRPIGSGIGSEVLLIPRATDFLEVLRQRWGPEIKDIARHFVARGMPFWHAYISAEIMPESKTPATRAFRNTTSGLGFRHNKYEFDKHDYNAYTTQRDLKLLHTARGRIALQYGGIIARLARSEVSDDDFFHQFDDEIYNVGDCLWDGESKHAYWHDKLSDHEIDLLCGVYHVSTGM
ncbi:hypothetical protein B0H13DRAFT_1635340 [Mycena leptocephala]|nr:hypothetical protein B0H13DRAFT_1635340 [Mycena leptocephala]